MEKRYGRLADEGERILVEDETTIYEDGCPLYGMSEGEGAPVFE